MKPFVIPEQVVFGKAKKIYQYSTPDFIITGVNRSPRAKNGVFVYTNKTFDNRVDKATVTRIRNIPRSGAKLFFSGEKNIPVIKHPDFGEYKIPIKNLSYFLENIEIKDGVISNEIIYTSEGFLPAPTAEKLLKKYEDYKKKRKNEKPIRDLEVGKAYACDKHGVLIYFGQFTADGETFHLFYTVPSYKIKELNHLLSDSKMAPEKISHHLRNNLLNLSKKYYESFDDLSRPYANTGYAVKARKTKPRCLTEFKFENGESPNLLEKMQKDDLEYLLRSLKNQRTLIPFRSRNPNSEVEAPALEEMIEKIVKSQEKLNA